MEFSFWVFAVLFIIALLYIFWDVNYFIRIAFTIGWGRLFQKKINLGDTSTIYGKKLYYKLGIIVERFNVLFNNFLYHTMKLSHDDQQYLQ